MLVYISRESINRGFIQLFHYNITYTVLIKTILDGLGCKFPLISQFCDCIGGLYSIAMYISPFYFFT